MSPGGVDQLSFREEMAFIHRAFRLEFAKLPDLVCAVTAPETDRRAAVAAWIDDALEMLGYHHDSEDDILWPLLRNRLRDNADALTLLDDVVGEHGVIHVAVETVVSALARWRTTGDEDDRDAVATTIFELNATVSAHFDREEVDLCPLAEGYLTREEWQRVETRGREKTSGKAGRALVGALLAHADERERRRYTGAIPGWIRWLVVPLAERSYDQRMRSMLGTG